MSTIVKFIIAVALLGIAGYFLRWVMTELMFPAMLVPIVWVVFALLVLVVIVGLFGYGPLRGKFGE